MSHRGATVLDRVAALPGGAGVLAHPECWIVGGAVRDALLGAPVRDLDVMVEGDAVAFAVALGDVVSVHERFGTAEVRVDGALVNVAMARTESYAAPGALPDVAPALVEDDLTRRDFSVNAVAVRAGDGRVLSVPGALEDLDARVLRVLHPGSFLDDPTRALRLARYAARLGLAIEPETLALARGADLGSVSGARVGAELRLALAEPDPVEAFETLARLELLPEWRLDAALARRALALAETSWDGSRAALATAGAEGVQRLRARLDALAFEAGDRDAIVEAASTAPALAEALNAARRPSEIARAARGAGGAALALAAALGADEAVTRWREKLRHVTLAITGDDLLAAGVPAGREVGRGLARALDARLDGEVGDDPQEQLRAALASAP